MLIKIDLLIHALEEPGGTGPPSLIRRVRRAPQCGIWAYTQVALVSTNNQSYSIPPKEDAECGFELQCQILRKLYLCDVFGAILGH